MTQDRLGLESQGRGPPQRVDSLWREGYVTIRERDAELGERRDGRVDRTCPRERGRRRKQVPAETYRFQRFLVPRRSSGDGRRALSKQIWGHGGGARRGKRVRQGAHVEEDHPLSLFRPEGRMPR